MSILVIAEHDGQRVRAGTLNAVTAAQKIGGDIALLIAVVTRNASDKVIWSSWPRPNHDLSFRLIFETLMP